MVPRAKMRPESVGMDIRSTVTGERSSTVVHWPAWLESKALWSIATEVTVTRNDDTVSGETDRVELELSGAAGNSEAEESARWSVMARLPTASMPSEPLQPASA